MVAASIVVGSIIVGLVTSCGGNDDGGTDAGASEPPASSVGDADPTRPAHAPGDTAAPAADGEQRHPDVVAAEATFDGDAWTFTVTISSPYDSPDRYADAWRVVGPDGTVYGERLLAHDHANEQPFTRSQGGIEIPDDVDTVLVEGRDLRYGWGGGVLTYDLPREASDTGADG